MNLFIRGVEKGEGGGKNKNVNRGAQAQQPDDSALLRFRKSGGRIGIGGVHTILYCAVKLKHARQITSPRLKDIPSGQTWPPAHKAGASRSLRTGFRLAGTA
jgi:hypothetical protein